MQVRLKGRVLSVVSYLGWLPVSASPCYAGIYLVLFWIMINMDVGVALAHVTWGPMHVLRIMNLALLATLL